jgi:glucose-6-phosphate 1-dehydrogenase
VQVLALTAMEPPVSLSAEHVRDEKVKVLRGVMPIQLSDVVLGQVRFRVSLSCVLSLNSSTIQNYAQFEGYKDDPDVPNDSVTPTYAAAVLRIRNPRWDGVPFILKCGKGLNERKAEIRIQLRDVPGRLFTAAQPNEIVVWPVCFCSLLCAWLTNGVRVRSACSPTRRST